MHTVVLIFYGGHRGRGCKPEPGGPLPFFMASTWISDGPNEHPGVYCIYTFNICNRQRQLIYIGSSKNVRRRVYGSGHLYRKLWSELPSDLILVIKWKKCQNYKDLEAGLIKKLRPPFNLQHTGINFRSYMIQL